VLAVINWRRAAEEVQATYHRYCPWLIIWRYGPVLLTDRTTEWVHTDQAGAL
jgi:hypothetical protein